MGLITDLAEISELDVEAYILAGKRQKRIKRQAKNFDMYKTPLMTVLF